MILLTLGLNNDEMSLARQSRYPLYFSLAVSQNSHKQNRSRGSPVSGSVSHYFARMTPTKGKQTAVALWDLGLRIFMKEHNRKAKFSLTVAQFSIVVVLDHATTVNNKLLSVALNAQRIIFSGHLT